MKISQEMEKKLASQWFAFLQRKILEEFQNLELEFSKKIGQKSYISKKALEKKDPKRGDNIIF